MEKSESVKISEINFFGEKKCINYATYNGKD